MDAAILDRILRVAPNLHTAGTFPEPVFRAIARHAGSRQIHRSAETGSGASTLLFSHLSDGHTVFAFDGGSNSIVNVRESSLLRDGVVTFVEGPTQSTLPHHRFADKLQLVLIDGPHGYPFPDLEYYYLYPHLDAGGLLILDDIHIPTVNNLFRFLSADAMFHLDEVVRSTAFFTRTAAPVFDPLGDGWWEQGYNRKTLGHYEWRTRMRALIPGSLRRRVPSIRLRGPDIFPESGAAVGASGTVEGTASAGTDAHLWILVRRKGVDGWWPQGAGPVAITDSRWSVTVNYGGPEDIGHEFEIAALFVGDEIHELWLNWVARVAKTGLYPPVSLPRAKYIKAEATLTVSKTSRYLTAESTARLNLSGSWLSSRRRF